MALDALQTDLSTVKLLLEDEEEKKSIVLEAIRKQCLDDSSKQVHPDLQPLQDAVSQEGHSLEAELISGGKTNYSFKIFAKRQDAGEDDDDDDDANHSELCCVFAKLFLPYALWDENRKYEFDMERATTEFEMMQLLDQRKSACCVAQPYTILNLEAPSGIEEDASRLILAKWSTGCDEQFANQHIDGHVDKRVSEGVAKALAQLNATPLDTEDTQKIDQDWNDRVRPGLLMVSPTAKMAFTTLTIMPDEECDALMLLMKEVGEITFDKVVDGYCRQINEARECLCHGDSHPFNILVEPKPRAAVAAAGSLDDLDGTAPPPQPPLDEKAFGPDGSFCICDWETAIRGPTGKDAGIFMAFPTACALCMAVQGHMAEAHHLLDSNMLFWTTYAQAMKEEAQKDSEDLREIYRVALGSLGAYMLFYLYILGVLGDTLPLDGVEEDEKSKARAAIGVVGLKLLVVGFDNTSEYSNLDLEGLQDHYKEVVTGQIEHLLLSKTSSSKPRRGSLLRTMQRRISDASSHQEAADKFSSNTLDWSYHKRISKFDNSVDLGASMCSFLDDDDDDNDLFPVTDELKMQWAEAHDDDF